MHLLSHPQQWLTTLLFTITFLTTLTTCLTLPPSPDSLVPSTQDIPHHLPRRNTRLDARSPIPIPAVTTVAPLPNGWSVQLQSYDTFPPAVLSMATYTVTAFYAQIRSQVVAKWGLRTAPQTHLLVVQYVHFFLSLLL